MEQQGWGERYDSPHVRFFSPSDFSLGVAVSFLFVPVSLFTFSSFLLVAHALHCQASHQRAPSHDGGGCIFLKQVAEAGRRGGDFAHLTWTGLKVVSLALISGLISSPLRTHLGF